MGSPRASSTATQPTSRLIDSIRASGMRGMAEDLPINGRQAGLFTVLRVVWLSLCDNLSIVTLEADLCLLSCLPSP